MRTAAEILIDDVHQCYFDASTVDEAVDTALEASKAPDDVAHHLKAQLGEHGTFYYLLLPVHECSWRDDQNRMWTLKVSVNRNATS